MSGNYEKDSMQDALIIATIGGPLIWLAIYTGFRLLDISMPVFSRAVLIVLAWLFIFLFWRIITREEPDSFQFQNQSGDCPNCGDAYCFGFCTECVPDIKGSPNHFTAKTKRKFTIVTYFMTTAIMYFAFFTIGYDLFLWDRVPNFDSWGDFLVNIIVAMTMFTIYGGLIYLMTMMMMIIFVNPVWDEIEAVNSQNYGIYEEYYFGKLNRNGKLAYLKQYNHEVLVWGWFELSKRLRDVSYTSVLGLLSWLSTITSILILDFAYFGDGIREILSGEIAGFIGVIVYLLSSIILVTIVSIARDAYEEYSKERVYRRVSHKFVNEFVDEQIQNMPLE